MTTNTDSKNLSVLETICSSEDIFLNLLAFVAGKDLSRLDSTSQTLRRQITSVQAWKFLCERDFIIVDDQCCAPAYHVERLSFDEMVSCQTWKMAYHKWAFWQEWTHNGVRAAHLVQAIDVWRRFKAWLEHSNLQNILDSLAPCPESGVFEVLTRKSPSSLLAMLCVHGGQRNLRPTSPDTEFFGAIFGGYSCYDMYYAMRSIHIEDALGLQPLIERRGDSFVSFLLAVSIGNPRTYMHLRFTEQDLPEGTIIMSSSSVLRPHLDLSPVTAVVVSRRGILEYFQKYVEQLEAGVYDTAEIIPGMPGSRGISLFPNAGPAMSCAVTHGIEVRASARWFPRGDSIDQQGVNFGYSIRIRMVTEMSNASTCQLVGRHWEFKDGDGRIRRVDGEAVVGKQPLFFLEDGKSGYVDLGHAGDGTRYPDAVFVYQSQSGPVRGTTPSDTKVASVQGTFSFVPGSIEEPAGDLFHVTVAPFPLMIPDPFF